MMYTLYRITGPILDKLPDLSLQPKRRQVTIGLVISVLFHLLLLLLAVVVGMFLPEHSLLTFAKPKAQLQEIELTVVPPEQQEMRLVPLEEIQNPQPFIDPRGLATSEAAPEHPLFESSENMRAASELPGRGDLPLPTQEGRTDRQYPEFSDHRMSLGRTVAPFPVNTSLAAAPPASTASPRQTAMEKPAMAATPAPAVAPLPTPIVNFQQREETTPPPVKEVAAPREDEISIAQKKAAAALNEQAMLSTPKPVQPRAALPKMRTTEPVAMLSTPAPEPAPTSTSTYQPLQEKTRIEGSISNRGKNAVDAASSPLGRYKKAVYDAVGSRWYYYTSQKTDVIAPGSVRVSFAIDGKGRVVGVKSESNTSNPSFAGMCEKAVRDADIVPPPADLMEPLNQGRLDFSITFTFHTF